MNTFKAFVCAALWSAAPLVALAQGGSSASALTDPANAQVTVPAPQYQSPLDDNRVIIEATGSPDKNWRSANEAVGNDAGMSGMDMSGAAGKPQQGGKP